MTLYYERTLTKLNMKDLWSLHYIVTKGESVLTKEREPLQKGQVIKKK